MARQNDEESTNRKAPEREPQPMASSRRGGGTRFPDKQQMSQLTLFAGTAANFPTRGGKAQDLRGAHAPRRPRVPKPETKGGRSSSATMEEVASHLRDALKQTIVRNLILLGTRTKTAWRSVSDGRKSLWKLGALGVVHRALRNAYFAERGLVSVLHRRFRDRLEEVEASAQLSLALG